MRVALNLFVCVALCAGLAGCETSSSAVRPLPKRSFERPPPKSPALSQGLCVMIHCDTFQSDSIAVKGPMQSSHRLSDSEIDMFWTSPIGGGLLDYRYPDGERVLWVPKVDRILKMRINSNNELEQLAELQVPTARFPYYDNDYMRNWVEELDELKPGSAEFAAKAAAWRGYQQEGLRAYYAMLNRDGILFLGSLDRIVAYTDAERFRADSGIRKAGEFVLDRKDLNMAQLPGLSKAPLPIVIGMSVLSDGHVVAVTVDGTVIAVTPNLRKAYYYKLGNETIWNSVAIDGDNGIYVVSNKRLRKLIWKGDRFSDAAADGAWSEEYETGGLDLSVRGARGSGAAPVLMGLENQRDQFVLIADGADVNNLVLYWRDEIPDNWRQLPGTSSRRVAGKVAVNFGRDDMVASHIATSPTVLGYGVVVGNNQLPGNEPAYLDTQLRLTDKNFSPSGLQKFVWDARRAEFRSAWIRPDVASPNSTPVVAAVNRRLYVLGGVNGKWTLSSLDWDNGSTEARWTLGASQRFNPIMLALQLLPNGDPVYNAFGGIVHLRIDNGKSWGFGGL